MSTTRTLTITGTIARMDAIVTQIEYVLRQVARLENRLIPNYLDAVRKKYITQFTFYGIIPGTWNADQYLVILIDWDKHIIETKTSPTINTTTDWQENVNPDIIMEAQQFLYRCNGLEINWDFTYSASGANLASSLRPILECGASEEYTPPSLPNRNTFSYSPFGIGEMKIKRNF